MHTSQWEMKLLNQRNRAAHDRSVPTPLEEGGRGRGWSFGGWERGGALKEGERGRDAYKGGGKGVEL